MNGNGIMSNNINRDQLGATVALGIWGMQRCGMVAIVYVYVCGRAVDGLSCSGTPTSHHLTLYHVLIHPYIATSPHSANLACSFASTSTLAARSCSSGTPCRTYQALVNASQSYRKSGLPHTFTVVPMDKSDQS